MSQDFLLYINENFAIIEKVINHFYGQAMEKDVMLADGPASLIPNNLNFFVTRLLQTRHCVHVVNRFSFFPPSPLLITPHQKNILCWTTKGVIKDDYELRPRKSHALHGTQNSSSKSASVYSEVSEPDKNELCDLKDQRMCHYHWLKDETRSHLLSKKDCRSPWKEGYELAWQ